MNFVAEPNGHLLNQPNENTLLYKMMRLENAIKSIDDRYIYFNRVDNYKDLSDGEQLTMDRPLNRCSEFEKAPDYNYENHCDAIRSRSYACCLSLENSQFIWDNYGDVCVVFEFGNLKKFLNKAYEDCSNQPNLKLFEYQKFFTLNYGTVKYIDRNSDSISKPRLPNPIEYLFLKDNCYSEDNELRIVFSCPHPHPILGSDKQPIYSRNNLHVSFDFVQAYKEGAIKEILCESEDAVNKLSPRTRIPVKLRQDQ